MEQRMLGAKRAFLNSWQLYVLLLPALAFVIVFRYGPMYGLQLAFKDYNARLGIFGSPWAGLKHVIRFFSYFRFKQVLFNTVFLSLYKLAICFPLPIILAIGLNEVKSVRAKKAIQLITYAPYFISVVVVVGIVSQLFSPHFGPGGALIKFLTGVPRDVMSDPKAFRALFVWTDAWQLTGYSAVLYIAALTAIDPEIYEAAEIDGANKLQRILNIDIPSIIPTATILLILEMGRVMDISFEKVLLLQSSLNLRTSEVLTTYVYKAGLLEGNFEFATAGGLFNSVVNFVLVVVVNKVASRLGGNSLW